MFHFYIHYCSLFYIEYKLTSTLLASGPGHVEIFYLKFHLPPPLNESKLTDE